MANAFIDDGRTSSVMDEMAALFAPPGREARNQKSRVDLHPYYKRPGKGHNHDSCDACGEGGDLICCDNCPASFHFSCHAPPLEEEDIPMGDWICLRCYHKEQMRLAATNANYNSNMVGIKREANSADKGSDASVTNGGAVPAPTSSTSTSRRRGKSKGKKQQHPEKTSEKTIKIYRIKYEKYLQAKPTTGSPFDALIAASQMMNAEQFTLPNELKPNESLPFSWKWADERQDDFDTYPKNCSVCSKTSRGVPTVGCDFCSSAYHIDCLDPPLCEIPKERWMCPNHVEHFVDANLVTNTSLTERLKLWNKHARAPINHDAVRLEFFRKVRTGKLYQKSTISRVVKPPDLRINVPSYIKAHYKNPIKGLPVEQSDTGQASVQPPEGEREGEPREVSQTKLLERNEEQDEWLRQLVALQTGILKEQMNAQDKLRKEEATTERLAKVARLKAKEKQRKIIKEKKPSKRIQNGRLSPIPTGHKADSDNGSVSSCSTASECSIGMEEDDQVSADAQAEICSYIARQKSMYPDVDAIDPTIRDFLAMQRMRELFSASSISTPSSSNQVQARAALVPVSNSKCRDPCPIQRRSVDIGLGSSVTIDLSKLGHCNFISSKHATIFYDQYSRVYELINYSEHGTIVDNIVYALDPSPHRQELSKAKSARFSQLKTMSATSSSQQPPKPCHCNNSVGEISYQVDHCCETSAVLHHGSFLRFGCLQFAFSVIDYQEEDEKKDKERPQVKAVASEAEAASNPEQTGESSKAGKDLQPSSSTLTSSSTSSSSSK